MRDVSPLSAPDVYKTTPVGGKGEVGGKGGGLAGPARSHSRNWRENPFFRAQILQVLPRTSIEGSR